MSQRDNFENGRGCLGVIALLMVVVLVGGFAMNTVVNAATEILTEEKP